MDNTQTQPNLKFELDIMQLKQQLSKLDDAINEGTISFNRLFDAGRDKAAFKKKKLVESLEVEYTNKRNELLAYYNEIKKETGYEDLRLCLSPESCGDV